MTATRVACGVCESQRRGLERPSGQLVGYSCRPGSLNRGHGRLLLVMRRAASVCPSKVLPLDIAVRRI